MRRPPQDGPKPHHRRTKGEKANKKQMACVGAVYSIEPFVRTADDILDEVLREERGEDRPVPSHKHVWAEMSRDVDGEPLSAKDAVFARAVRRPEPAQRRARPAGGLPDGRRARVVGGATGLLPRGGGDPGPVPRPGAALDRGALLPRRGERCGRAVRRGSTAGPVAGPSRLRHRRTPPAPDQAPAERLASQDVGVGDRATWRTTGSR